MNVTKSLGGDTSNRTLLTPFHPSLPHHTIVVSSLRGSHIILVWSLM